MSTGFPYISRWLPCNGAVPGSLGIDVMGHVWTAPGWQEESSLCSVGRSSHVFGLFARYP
jgi:hypothetical protein